jgi:hypothetical protein
MTPNTINQEVLLFTGTSFSKRQLCEKDQQSGNEPAGSFDQLQKACWSGMLFEMLPDLLEISPVKIFIWEVIPGDRFIRVKSGTSSESIESQTSIDPYFLLPVKNFN